MSGDVTLGALDRILLPAMTAYSPVASNTVTASYVTNATAATVAGLSLNLPLAGATYQITGQLIGSATSSGGLKAQLNGINGLTVSALNLNGQNYNGTTENASTNITALATDFSNSSAAYTNLYFDGTLTVGVPGTLVVQAAQHTSNSTTTTVTAGSYINLTRIS